MLFSKCVLIVEFLSPLHSIDFTEELLEAHEAEAAKVGVIMLLDVHLDQLYYEKLPRLHPVLISFF